MVDFSYALIAVCESVICTVCFFSSLIAASFIIPIPILLSLPFLFGIRCCSLEVVEQCGPCLLCRIVLYILICYHHFLIRQFVSMFGSSFIMPLIFASIISIVVSYYLVICS